MEYERKINNNNFFRHEVGDYGEEIVGVIGKNNNWGKDISEQFQTGRNGLDKVFLSEGPPPKLTIIESKALRKGIYTYSDVQKLGGEGYFNNMLNSSDARYRGYAEKLQDIKDEFPDLIVDYKRVETKVKITDIGFGAEDVTVKDWSNPIY